MEAKGTRDASPGVTEGNDDEEALREQDRYLPIANIGRIMKAAIPEHGKVSRDAKLCMQECVSEFISFITSEASDRCHQEKRKTINGEDVIWAMQSLGFDNYIGPLKIYLQKYRESVKNEKGAASIEGHDSPQAASSAVAVSYAGAASAAAHSGAGVQY